MPNEELVAETYRGIRPAFGYPACPDHSQKRSLFDLLEAREIGIDLTDAFAMTPAASVSGLYFAHPESRYFNVGRIAKDQLEDYARRRGESIARGGALAPPEPGVRHGLSGRPGPDVPSTRPRVGAAGSLGRMAHFWHPFADMASVSAHGELVLVRGDGVRVWDESGGGTSMRPRASGSRTSVSDAGTSPTRPPRRWPRSPRTRRSATCRTARRRSWPSACRPSRRSPTAACS